jgi:5'-nucleotidase
VNAPLASGRPLVLLTNDDAYGAAGLEALASACEAWCEPWIVAPATEQSGVSSSLSLHSPVRIKRHGERRFSVTGTPADCVYMALEHVLPRRPDLCISGVNHGANLGDDVIYSGTVAAAVEATLADVPSLAVSLAAWGRGLDYGPAAALACRVAPQLLTRLMPRGTLLNLNVPAEATADADIEVAKLGRRDYERRVTEQRDPRGRPYYWIGGAALDSDDIPGSDCNVVAGGGASLTPLSVDMTQHRFMRELSDWNL